MREGLLDILLVEDNLGDAHLLRETLDASYPGNYAITIATSLGEAKSHLARQTFDAVLLDLSLPDSHGLQTVIRLRGAAPWLAVVVLTGLDDEELGLEAVRRGAQDYLFKGRIDGWGIARAIRYAIERKQIEEVLRSQQRELEAKNRELQEAQRRLEAYRDRYVDLYELAPVGYLTLDEDGYIQEINLTGAAMLGKEREELTGFSLSDFLPEEDRPAVLEHVRRCSAGRREVISELNLFAKNGQPRLAQLRSIAVDCPDEESVFWKTAIAEITRSKK